MSKLLKYFTKHNLTPTPWAIKNDIPPSTVSRCINGKNISWENAKKISAATLGEVSVVDLMNGE